MSIPAEGRIRMLEKQRQQQVKDLEEKKKKISEASTVVSIGSKFASRKDFKEDKLKKATFGLVTHQEFIDRQESLEIGEDLAPISTAPTLKGIKRRKPKPTIGLSFGDDDEEEEEEVTLPARKKQKIGKNPAVDTSFLPDKERDAQEWKERMKLKKQWLKEQKVLKESEITVTYSYWDGCGHRRCQKVIQDTSIDRFLMLVRDEFKELRAISIDNLLFVKEDLIIPHRFSFYDLIATKARGKSGPLFDWNVREDIRMLADATREKDESHAAKVVERGWYERNKHMFPANRWEVYDPSIDYGKYTAKDSKK